MSEEKPRKRRRSWLPRLLFFLLLISILINFGFYAQFSEYFAAAEGPRELFYGGEKTSDAKVAVIEISGTIMPPLTEDWISSIEKAGNDPDVKGVLLVVDSPGGIVADSHQIYHALKKVSAEKPFAVAMKRLAASGGLYVAMGAGPDAPIYAEPTTWTGSIGVIIPRYDLTKLGEKVGIGADAIKTGKFKDSLNPFNEVTPEEQELWRAIIEDSFELFVEVIAENRPELDAAQVRELATGQIFTSSQAKEAGLVDEIGFEQAAIENLKGRLGLSQVRLVQYQHPIDWTAYIPTARAASPIPDWRELLESSVPRAYYLMSTLPAIASSR